MSQALYFKTEINTNICKVFFLISISAYSTVNKLSSFLGDTTWHLNDFIPFLGGCPGRIWLEASSWWYIPSSKKRDAAVSLPGIRDTDFNYDFRDSV